MPMFGFRKIENQRLNQIIVLSIVLIIGLAADVGLYNTIRNLEETKLVNDFDSSVRKLNAGLERSIAAQELTLIALQKHVASAYTRDKFSEFADPFIERVDGIQALEWVPRIEHKERQSYLGSARYDGIKDFDIKVIDDQGKLVSAPTKDVYYPVYYVEPYDGNESVLGFDLSSNEDRFEALMAAAQTGASKSTGHVDIVQDSTEQSAYLIVFPVYKKSFDAIPDGQRIDQLLGFAVGVFVVDDIVEESVDLLSISGIDIYISDITDSDNPESLYYYSSTDDENASEAYSVSYFTSDPDQLHQVSQLTVSDRTWRITYVPTEQYMNNYTSNHAYMFFAAGLFVTFLLLAYFNANITRAITVNDLVETRTLQLEKAKQEAEEAKDIAEKANMSKTEFLSNVSHELRTPLNGILGLSHTLLESRNENLSEKQVKSLEMIHRSGMRLLDIINDILDLTKIEAGKMSYNERPVRIKGILDFAENLCKGLMENRIAKKQDPLDVIIKTEGFTPEFFMTDRKLLEQILVNIIGNAFKFTQSGSVTISVKVINHSLWFEIRDTGIGIAREQLDLIFNKFHQGDGSSTRSYEGTGLGLALCKSLVELMEGDIRVESVLEEGTTMKFGFLMKDSGVDLTIPPYEKKIPKDRYYPFGHVRSTSHIHSNLSKLRKSLSTKLTEDDETEEAQVIPPAEDAPDIEKDLQYERLQNKSILICSSDDTVRSRLRKYLSPYPVSITERNSATSAFEIFADIEPDLIVLEPNLPDMPAENFIQMVKTVYASMNPAFVYITEDEKTFQADAKTPITLIKPDYNGKVFLEALCRTFKSQLDSIDKDSRAHILIADDEHVGRELLRLLLEKKYRLTMAENGEEAVQLYFETSPDLVLMDIMMPKLDGIGALTEITKRSPDRVPIVALTAKAMKDDESALLDHGFDGYISKPFNSKRMPAIIASYLEKRDADESDS